jgi:predicted porin
MEMHDMKKSLLALAVLGAFAGVASAQSSVTLYGRVDLAATKFSGTDNKSLNNGSGSRLGVRGVEDLGGGLQALFNLEHRFNADTGAQSDPNRFWFGRSIVGLQGAWGSVTLGREYTLTHSFTQNVYDPWGHDTVVSAAFPVAASTSNLSGTIGLTRLGIATARNDSAITYKYSMAGFSFGAQIAEGTDQFTQVQNKPWNAGVRYQAGPIDVGFGYEATGAEAAAKAEIMSINGSYNFGVVKAGLWYGQGTTSADIDRRSYSGFVTAPLGAGELRALIGRVEQKGPGADWDTANTIGGVGYHYSLSKRTTVYADYVRNTGHYVVSKDGYDFGLKHNF